MDSKLAIHGNDQIRLDQTTGRFLVTSYNTLELDKAGVYHQIGGTQAA